MNTTILSKVLAAGAAFAALAIPATSLAASGTWIGGGTSDFYSNSTNWSGGTIASGTDATAIIATGGYPNSVYLDSSQTVGNIGLSESSPNWYVEFHGSGSDVLTLATSSGTPTMNLASYYDGWFDWSNMTVAGNQGLELATGYNTLNLEAGLSWTATGTLTFFQPGSDANNVFAIGNNVLPGTMDLNVTGGSAGSLIVLNGSTTETIGALTGGSQDYIAAYGSTSASALHEHPTGTNGTSAAATLEIGNTNDNGSFGGVIGRSSSGDTSADSAAINLVKVGTGAQTFTGTIDSSGSVTVSSGTLQLNGATLSVTGATNVNSGGVLEITGDNSETAGSEGRIFVNSGGSLIGNGKLSLSDTTNSLTGLSIAGNVSPGVGESIGTLTIDRTNSDRAAAAFETGATFSFKLGADLTSDEIDFTDAGASDVFFNNNVINFTDLTGGGLNDGQYVLFAADSADAFDEGEYSALRTNGSGYVTAGLSIGSGLSAYPGSSLQEVGNNIVLNVVPEPGTWGLIVAGAGILVLWKGKGRGKPVA